MIFYSFAKVKHTSLVASWFKNPGHTRSLHASVRYLTESKLNNVPIDRTRNIGVIAHIDAGKTTTTETMLYYSGETRRIGKVDDGDTVTDYLPSERERGITIQLAAISIPWNNKKINIIDTPGHADFSFEVIRSLRVLDGAITIFDAVAGVEAQSEKVWKQAASLEIPRIAYINKMDRVGAGFSRTVREMIQKLQTRVVLCNIPYFEKDQDNELQFKGVIDVLNKKILKWKSSDDTGNQIEVVDLEKSPTEYEEQLMMIQKCRESMIETLGEIDDEVVDEFLNHNEDYMQISATFLTKAIKRATISNLLTPVFCGSSFKHIGVQPLMDAVVNFLPSPLEIKLPEVKSSTSKLSRSKKKKQLTADVQMDVPIILDSKKGLIFNKNPNLTVALAFKVMTHATRGVLTFFRVYSGKLMSNTTVINTRTGKKLHFKKLLLMHGEDPETVPYISSGNIGVIAGTEDDIITGDTLVSHGALNKLFSPMESNLKLLPIEIPPPLFNSSIEPLTAGDERYIKSCIAVLIREDPSLKVSEDEDLGQTTLSGMGELHLDIIKERLIRDMKANVRFRDVAVSYKESPYKPNNQKTTERSDETSVSVTVELDSFEGEAVDSMFSEEDGAYIFPHENNIVILEPSATPNSMMQAMTERRWKSDHSLEDLQETLIQGCLTALQLGGPILSLPLHSTVVRIKAWNFPVFDKTYNSSLLMEAARKAVSSNIHNHKENAFSILEPIMVTRIFVNSDVLGDVVHDLTHKRHAIIISIDDEHSDNLENLTWASKESERIYLPPDYTMSSNNIMSELSSKKVITAHTPLREMVGYLSKLRSMTQGRSDFSMTYLGMRRALQSRLATLVEETKIV
ncbi:uncharacterized protein PRCAT00001560001 [Priceomyces carsonii]|uniref:uncharacterized protein n=1 Tax=Priceomyces carsonii TaxID=28549 RepID=UPI002EDA2EFA|nr:unnamed protein product [Priceomyces carsonii]